jgi:hypothetical protein
LLLGRQRLDALPVAWVRLGTGLRLERRRRLWLGRLVWLALQSTGWLRRSLLGRLVHRQSALLDVRRLC